MANVLSVRDLEVAYRTRRGELRAVDRISFSLDDGDYLGLVGESGSGKSTVAKALLGILAENARIAGGDILLRGKSLRALGAEAMRKLRWTEIALVPQTAMSGFDPVQRVRGQIEEAMRVHRAAAPRPWRDRIEKMFDLVGLARSRLDDYPHQFSGGMRQRAMIAMAMVLDPDLVVADEPTTGLDVIVQDQIMRKLKAIHTEGGSAMLLVTHDLALVAENCNRIAVMYAGRIVEYGGEAVLQTPLHPYTMGLCAAFPDLDERDRELIAIPGSPPDLAEPITGCRFHARCPFATALCRESDPALREIEAGRFSACHHAEQATSFRAAARLPATWAAPGDGVTACFRREDR